MANKRKKSEDEFENKKRKTGGRILSAFSSSGSSSEDENDPKSLTAFTSNAPDDSSSKESISATPTDSESLLPSQLVDAEVMNGKSGENHYDSDTEEEADAQGPSGISRNKTKPSLEEEDKSTSGEENGLKHTTIMVKKNGQAKLKKKSKKPTFYDDNNDESYGMFGEEASSDEDDDRDHFARMKPDKRTKIVEFFEKSSIEELCFLSKCSEKKAKLLMELRPFTSWKNLLDKMDNHKLLNRELVLACVSLLKERNVLCGLMKRCSEISANFQREFSRVENENKFVSQQPQNIPDKLTLKPYQLIGVNWVALLHRHNVNGVLADEMGLGKTIQTIAFLAHLVDSGISSGPHLIVVPSSTCENWLREFEVWCPELKVINYAGNQAERRQIRHNILNSKLVGNVIITTYNLAISQAEDRALFRKLNTYFAVFDEGHMLKNMSSQRYQYLQRLNAQYRLLLTGTPLQNNLLELMSLLKFVMPQMFDESTSWLVKMFSRTSTTSTNFAQQRIAHAKQIMQPFVLRRLKADVLSQMPKKVDRVEECPLTLHQQALYDKVKTMFQNKSDGKKLPKNELKNMFVELRKIANHPLLRRERFSNDKLLKMARILKRSPSFCESNEKYLYEDLEVMTDFELNRFCNEHKCVSKFKFDDSVIAESGKFKKLDELLPKFKDEGKRVLLFTQFTMVLDIIEYYLNLRKFKYLRLDGQTPVNERLNLIDTFNNDQSYSLFILSTKAGGLGINLTSASVVILHDIDWNPYNDKQAEDRCHRMGQTKTVEVIRLLGKDTIEVAMHKSALQKLNLEKEMTDNSGENDMDMVALITKNIL